MEGLLTLFVTLTVSVGLGSVFLFLSKSPKVKNILFYFVAILGMFIAWLRATSLPTNYVTQIVITWIVGFISIIGIVMWFKDKKNIAKWMVVASAVLGLIQLIFFL